MAVRPLLFALAAMGLGGCASTEYGYAYCYDAYGGPVGYYTGPLEPKPVCATQGAGGGVFVTRNGDDYRGAYVSGPYPAPVAEGAVDAVSREAVR